MNTSTWFRRLLVAAVVIAGLSLASACRADDKDKKGTGKDEKNVIIIQLDASKAPPALVRQLMELTKATGKEDKKSGQKSDDDDDDGKKKAAKKGDDDGKKGAGAAKPNVVQVDLNRLPPDLAKRLAAELARSKDKGDDKKSGKDDDDKKGSKSKSKKDDDDDDKKSGKAKKDDDDDDEDRKSRKRDD